MGRILFFLVAFVFQSQLNAEVIVGKDFLNNANKFPSVAFVCGKPAMVWNITRSKWEKDDSRDCINDPKMVVQYCNQKYAGQGFGQFKSVMPWPHEVLIDDWCDFFETSCTRPRRTNRVSTTRPQTTTKSLAVPALVEDTEYVYDDGDYYDSSEQLDPLAVALQTSFSVRPFRCLDAPQQSDTLVVPQGKRCEFLHVESPGVMEALLAANAPATAASAAAAAPQSPSARRARRNAPFQTAAASASAPPAGCFDYWAWNQTVTHLCTESRRSLFSFVPILPCDAGTFGGVQYVCCAAANNNNNAASSNQRASTAGDTQVLDRLMRGEWPLPQPQPRDALRRLLNGEPDAAAATTASPAAASGNGNANDADDKNYYVEYMLRPGSLGASETVRFRNSMQLVRRQHDRLADKYKAEYSLLVQRLARENSVDANARLQQATNEHEERLKLNDETERNMLELMRQVHRQRIHQEDRQQRSNALAELHGELNLMEMLGDDREALKELPYIVRALLHYLRAEEKERIHRINMYEFDEDRDQSAAAHQRVSLRLSLLDIASRINQTMRLVDKLPPRLQEHIRNAIDQFLEGYEDVDDEIRVLFPNGLRSANANANAAAAAASGIGKTKAPFLPKSPPALEGTATPPVTGAGRRRAKALAAADDPRINLMPESDYDYDHESGELEIENIEQEVEEHVANERAAPTTARTATAAGTVEYDYKIEFEPESDELVASATASAVGPHKTYKAVSEDVGGSLLPVPQLVDSELLPEAQSSVADAAVAIGSVVRAHAILAVLVALLGLALLVALAILCISMLRARQNRMRYRQLQMPTVTTLVESEKEKGRASIDSASLESASLADAELQQMQINGFENPTYKLFENK